jgi:arylsulfatase A-like enzyme
LARLVDRRIARGGLAVGFAAALLAALAQSAPASAHPERPNFLVIQVDDQATNTFDKKVMPHTWHWLVRGGTRFTNGLAAPPLCCPDRAGVLTGQYPHNHGVFSNDPGYGSLRNKHSTMPVWLHRAGYRTALVGKFLNQYTVLHGGHPAPGFDDWFAFDGLPGYYHYGISNNGRHVEFHHARRDYSTDVFTRAARNFIHRSAQGKRPFFLWLAPNAPHDTGNGGSVGKRAINCPPVAPTPPGHRALRRFAHLKMPTDPSFNEADVADKPPDIASLPPIDAAGKARITRRFRCTAATMHATDRDVGRIKKELKRTGELKHTIVIYISDNGVYFGEHRLTRGKVYPYEPALQVPFAIRVPRAYRRSRKHRISRAVVSNTDIAPTLLDYARKPPPCNAAGKCRVLDGRSMRPLLGGGGKFPRDRGVLAEIDTDTKTKHIAYAAIRTPDRLYVDYQGSQRELYNLDTDPFELANLAGDPQYLGEQLGLAARLAALEGCSGTSGADPCE